MQKALRYDRVHRLQKGSKLVLVWVSSCCLEQVVLRGSQRQQRGTGLGHMESAPLSLGGLAGWDTGAGY